MALQIPLILFVFKFILRFFFKLIKKKKRRVGEYIQTAIYPLKTHFITVGNDIDNFREIYYCEVWFVNQFGYNGKIIISNRNATKRVGKEIYWSLWKYNQMKIYQKSLAIA